jgi:hypothetical protein
MPERRSTRGRKPSIGVAAAKLTEVRRTLRALSTEIRRLQQRLRALDSFYSKQTAALSAGKARQSRRGPNVRDIAYQVLRRTRNGLPIQDLAAEVIRRRGRKSGRQFAQNLAVALGKDDRFRRIDRGVYAAR